VPDFDSDSSPPQPRARDYPQAHAQVLASLLRTIQQRELDVAALLTDILRAPEPIVPLALTGVQR
jgi:hypothetical protein